jgi:hypothetical protein
VHIPILLIRKTQLESRKLEYEIAEKARSAQFPSLPSVMTSEEALSGSSTAIAETLINRRYSIILLRYVVLELALSIYRGITVPLQWLESLAIGGLYIVSGGHFLDTRVSIVLAGTQTVAATLVDIGYWLVFLVLGWPLFKDVNAALGIRLNEYSPVALIKSIRTLNRH